MADEEKETRKAEDILQEAQERFTFCQEAETRSREEALDDLYFLTGNQWPEKIKQQRLDDGSPCLTLNRLMPFVRQITNQQRQNRVAALVRPVDDRADVDTAEVLQGLVRSIERQSYAESAYENAAFYAAAMGWGYFRIVTDYCDPTTFDQDIRIQRIRNPFSVYLDPTSVEPDGSDADFGFITEQLTRQEFERMYPNADRAALDTYSWGDGPKDWVTEEEIRVVEYFYREKRKETLVLLQNTDGTRLAKLKSELPEELPEGVTIVKERETEIPYIQWCKLNAAEILDQTEWPGQWIPIVKVVGSEVEVDGRLQLSGVVRFSKDAQRQYNYMASAETEAIALEPRSPAIVVEGQIEGYEKEWKNAAVSKQAYLQIRPVSIAGQPAPFPTRLAANPNIAALSLARSQAGEDIKAIIGIYDAGLGNRSTETSGRAILARTQQGEISNFHFADNLRRSIEHCCRILVDLIPKIYDTARVVRIMGEEDQERVVKINQIFEEHGEEKSYWLNRGRYDVVTVSGPSFATQRQQAAEQLIALAQAYPGMMQVAGDLFLKHLDIPGAMEISERLKKALPPQWQEGEDGKKPLPPEAQRKIQQMSQMIEALTQQLNAATETLTTKKLELDSRERIETMRIQAQMTQSAEELDTREAIAMLKAEVERLKANMDFDAQQAAREAKETAQTI